MPPNFFLNKGFRIFLLLSLFSLLPGIYVSLKFYKLYVNFWLNDLHGYYTDYFFKWITHFGDGLFFTLVSFLFFSRNMKKGLLFFTAFLSSSLLAQLLKKVVFTNSPRPIEVVSDVQMLKWVEGVQIHHWDSFPSGHTVSAFVLAALLVWHFKSSFAAILFFCLAAATAISRVYLNQHFLQDVIAGSVIGILVSWLLIYFYEHLVQQNKFQGLDKPLFRK